MLAVARAHPAADREKAGGSMVRRQWQARRRRQGIRGSEDRRVGKWQRI